MFKIVALAAVEHHILIVFNNWMIWRMLLVIWTNGSLIITSVLTQINIRIQEVQMTRKQLKRYVLTLTTLWMDLLPVPIILLRVTVISLLTRLILKVILIILQLSMKIEETTMILSEASWPILKQRLMLLLLLFRLLLIRLILLKPTCKQNWEQFQVMMDLSTW